jgi:hypothetical protein
MLDWADLFLHYIRSIELYHENIQRILAQMQQSAALPPPGPSTAPLPVPAENPVLQRQDAHIDIEFPLQGNFQNLISAFLFGQQQPEQGAAPALDLEHIISGSRVVTAAASTIDCTVCHTPLHEAEFRALNVCNHAFHSHCIIPWLQRNGSCPNCRARVGGVPAAPVPQPRFSAPGDSEE